MEQNSGGTTFVMCSVVGYSEKVHLSNFIRVLAGHKDRSTTDRYSSIERTDIGKYLSLIPKIECLDRQQAKAVWHKLTQIRVGTHVYCVRNLCKHLILLVGVVRFELTASCSRSMRANRAALHPAFYKTILIIIKPSMTKITNNIDKRLKYLSI